jgi:hypothetical protein
MDVCVRTPMPAPCFPHLYPGVPTQGLCYPDRRQRPPDLQYAETAHVTYAFHAHAGGNILRLLNGAPATAAGGLIATCATLDLLLQHPDETHATYV